MSTNYKPFKDLGQMLRQPASKHWFARHELTKKEGFGGPKKKEMAKKMTKASHVFPKEFRRYSPSNYDLKKMTNK